VQPIVIFSQSTISNFAIAKNLFYVPKRMLDFGSNTGIDLLGFQFNGI
jgi:hypothetical protein